MPLLYSSFRHSDRLTLIPSLISVPVPLLDHKDPFCRAYSCIRFLHVAHDCLGKGIFCFNLAFSQGGTKGTSFLELVSLRKLFRIASFLSRLTDAYNPSLSAIVRHNFFIILCPFHLENPSPIKVIQPSNTCSQLNLSCTACPDAAGHSPYHVLAFIRPVHYQGLVAGIQGTAFLFRTTPKLSAFHSRSQQGQD